MVASLSNKVLKVKMLYMAAILLYFTDSIGILQAIFNCMQSSSSLYATTIYKNYSHLIYEMISLTSKLLNYQPNFPKCCNWRFWVP